MKIHTLIAASLALLVVSQMPGQMRETSAKPLKTLSLAQMWKLDATYTDQQHGVTFQYPSVWQATMQFAYHPPALTQSDFARPIAGFGYSEGGFPRNQIVGPYSGTDLEGVGFIYSAVPAASAAHCETWAISLSDSPKRSKVVIGGRSFSEYETGEGGMSQSISGNLYATYAGGTCYLFEADVAMVSASVVDDIKPLDPPQVSAIFGHLTEIMKSVRITPKKLEAK